MVIRVSCLKVWLCHMGFCRVVVFVLGSGIVSLFVVVSFAYVSLQFVRPYILYLVSCVHPCVSRDCCIPFDPCFSFDVISWVYPV